MKTYQSVKNDAFERASQISVYKSSFPLFPRHEVSGKESDPSAPQLRVELTILPRIRQKYVTPEKFKVGNSEWTEQE